MTVSDIDIYRTAKLLIDLHGVNARIEATMKYDALTESGDIEGRKVWRRVGDAIETLTSRLPTDTEN